MPRKKTETPPEPADVEHAAPIVDDDPEPEAPNPHADLIDRIDAHLPLLTRGEWHVHALLTEARNRLAGDA